MQRNVTLGCPRQLLQRVLCEKQLVFLHHTHIEHFKMSDPHRQVNPSLSTGIRVSGPRAIETMAFVKEFPLVRYFLKKSPKDGEELCDHAL